MGSGNYKKQLDIKRITEAAKSLGLSTVFYRLTDSTNTRAHEYAKGGNCGRDVLFIAERQSAGRGRRGRSFLSDEGGIYISVLCYPRTGERVDPTALTAHAAVGLALPIERATGVEAKIKWVNDIYIGGKKVCGILCEGEFDESGNLGYYIIGMGINVYKNAKLTLNVPIATTLEDNTDLELDISDIAIDALRGVMDALRRDHESVLCEYRERSYTVGRRVCVHDPKGEYGALAVGIGDDYSLTVRTDGGEVSRIFTGDVSVSV